jgi:riboflavin transporter 2
MMVTCGIAFVLLNYLPYCKTEHVNKIRKNKYELEINKTTSSTQKFAECNGSFDENFEIAESTDSTKNMTVWSYVYFLLLIGWVNALTNGVLPSVQSFACLPYGSEAYHLAVSLSNIANPVACFIAFFLPVGSAAAIGLISAAGSVVSVYILLLAAGSPTPWLVDSDAGGALAVSIYVL